MEISHPPPPIELSHSTMDFSVPPPVTIPPPSIYLSQPPPQHKSSPNISIKSGPSHFRSYPFNRPPGLGMTQDDFDGKRLRKSVMRKTVDYNAAIIKALENRIWQRDHRDRRSLQPESIYVPELMPPPSYMDNPINSVTTRFVKTATNKMRCPIFTLAWTPEGRRLVTGASSGEFTLWNGLTFNFETILQAHDVPVRTMVWSHNDNWMVTGDHSGYVKYWQSNMNNVRMYQAHKEAIRGISFSPSDSKFVSCSDDGTLRIFDFLRCQEERVLRGHGADVKCVHWHPQKALIVSGSKDNQQPIKLWDPKSGQALATLHAHKSTVMDLKWNSNGNWLVTASRDHLLKLFDLRNLREEVQVFRGHKKEASAVAWHPIHEGLFASGGSDGSMLFWNVGTDKEVGAIDAAHDSIVWTLAWHPLGHILCSGSNDHTIKFWTRNRPGDQMRDKYNLNTLPPSLQGLEDCEIVDELAPIPGISPEDKIDFTESLTADRGFIPGLDLDTSSLQDRRDRDKKVPYSKPIPRNFQAHWNDTGREDQDETTSNEIKEAITQIVENAPGVPLQKIAPSAVIVYGKTFEVIPGSTLEQVISEGSNALNHFITNGGIEELIDLLPSRAEMRKQLEMHPYRQHEEYDHNPQLVFDRDNQPNPSFIPPLMALNVTPVRPNCDSRPLQMNGGTHDMMGGGDNGSGDGGGFGGSDGFGGNDGNNFGSGGGGGGPQQPWPSAPSNKPISLFDLNVARPSDIDDIEDDDDEDSVGKKSKWGPPISRDDKGSGGNYKDDSMKRRKRDSDGRRVSRFDNADKDRKMGGRSTSGNRSGRSNRAGRNRR